MINSAAQSNAHRDVTNLCYQMLVQFRELFKSSPSEAMLRYNFDQASADRVLKMSHEELMELANKGILCFAWKTLTEQRTQHVERVNQGERTLHVA